MCELLGFTSRTKIKMNGLLETFFSHSEKHPDGWGLALLDEDPYSVEKEPQKALDSLYLKNKLKDNIETSLCIAHIRKATMGDVIDGNTHPFSRNDDSGRKWVLAHNGTIFESEQLAPYQYVQEGATDSERILLYLVDEINKRTGELNRLLSGDERIGIVENVIHTIVPGNKVDLMIYDGDLLYIHKNEEGTLYEKTSEGSILFATVPLDQEGWHEFPQNRLMVYRDGKPVYAGTRHNNTYVVDKEKMKLLYLAYSGL